MARRTERLVSRFSKLDQRLLLAFVAYLRRFFGDQALRVLARYLGLYAFVDVVAPQPAAEELLPDQERLLLRYAMMPFIERTLVQTASLAGNLVAQPELAETDPRIAMLLNQSATAIPGIHRTTLGAIRATLAEGALRGYTVEQIAHGVPDDGYRGLRDVVAETYKGRAETIARTELARASALAALEQYQQAGAGMVYVLDGVECGWLFHTDDDKANDTWRTIVDAQQHPLAHPNCVRRFLPPRPGTQIPFVPPPPTPSARRLRISVSLQAGGRPVPIRQPRPRP